MTLAQIAVTFFLIMDPFGNIPAFLALLKNFDAKHQRKIILREMLVALGVIIFFNYLGNEFLELIEIRHSTVQLAGGIILFIIALQMIFPKSHHGAPLDTTEEPFLVPLAIPLVAGPSLLGSVMVFAHEEEDLTKTTIAIIIAWVACTAVLLASSWFKKVLGTRALIAGERLMGLIMTILAVDLFTSGITAAVQ